MKFYNRDQELDLLAKIWDIAFVLARKNETPQAF